MMKRPVKQWIAILILSPLILACALGALVFVPLVWAICQLTDMSDYP